MESVGKAGEKTVLFGLWLTEYLRTIPKFQENMVFYDHGDPTINLNVAAIKGFYGKKLTRINQLTEVDLLVAKPNFDIVALVEIEERNCPPKKIIGDIFTLLMCNRFSVKLNKHQYFNIVPETKLFIAGTIAPNESRVEQLKGIIRTWMQDYSAPPDSLKPENIEFVFGETIEATVDAIRNRMTAMFLE